MSICKDCIHYEEFCDRKTIPSAPICRFFKDRSKFIELPCDIGGKLYLINGKGEILSWDIICVRTTKSSLRYNPEHIEITIGCDNKKRNGILWIELDKAKNVYFSYEEAEQALKERKKE